MQFENKMWNTSLNKNLIDALIRNEKKNSLNHQRQLKLSFIKLVTQFRIYIEKSWWNKAKHFY